MPERTSERTLVTGRPLDERGEPADGPALELDPAGPAADLLRSSPRPLVSSPGAGTWATLLARPDEASTEAPTEYSGGRPETDAGDRPEMDSGERPELLQWLAPDASQPPPHVHPTTETFRTITGELTVDVDGEVSRLGPGETVTVQAGAEHTFRNDTDEVVAFRAELPSMVTVRALYSVWGMDHEGVFGTDSGYGEPGPLRGLLLAEALDGETTVTTAPVAVQRVLRATVGRAARGLGFRAIDDRYLEEAFWKRHVEQPSL